MPDIDTLDSPQSTATIAPAQSGPDPTSALGGAPTAPDQLAAVQQQAAAAAPVGPLSDNTDQMLVSHQGLMARVAGRVADALGGSGAVNVTKDDTGIHITPKQESGSEKWSRIAATALQGMAAGYAVPNGPGNLGRAAAAGVGTGVQIQQQQRKQQVQQADDDYDTKQKAQLHNATMVKLNQQIAEGTWDLNQKKATWIQGMANRDNDINAQMMENGGEEMGTLKSSADLPKLAQSNPDIFKDHTSGRIVTVPQFDGDSNSTGVRVVRMNQAWGDRLNDKPVTIYRPKLAAGAKIGDRPTMQPDVIPAGSMKNKDIVVAQHANDAQGVKLSGDWHEQDTKDANTASEINLRGAQAGEARASAARSYAEADKAKAGTPDTTAGPLANPAQEAQAQQIANGDAKTLHRMRGVPENGVIMDRVYQINPRYTDSLYTATQDLRSTHPNSMGANVGRLGTAILHGDEALKGSTSLGVSPGLLTGVKTTGTAAYRQSAEFLTGEVGQYVDGGKLTISQGEDIKRDMFSSLPEVRNSAIHQIIKLSGGKLQSQMESFKNATQNDFPTERVFNDPGIHGALTRHGIISAPVGQQGGQGGQTVSVTAPDGSTHAFANQQSADNFKRLAGIK